MEENTTKSEDEAAPKLASNFVTDIVDEHNRTNRFDQRVHTRFPPEPNGYLHIGHAKAICLDFGIAAQYGGKCNLRFDDSNPSTEDQEYVDSIERDVKWLGFDWGEKVYFASDYFEQLFQYAVALIKKGKAYVCGLSADEVTATRGTLTEGGKDSPGRS
ncbi:MAG TPA: glutamate--tRNA ligase family protein, partial [Oligoflexia bacterium]|nr:glutamate--tRNA ligase family protein [Oligoflexia bacterium]